MSDQLREALARWQETKAERLRIALDILDNGRLCDPSWPEWYRYDILAEVSRIRQQRASERQRVEQEKRAKAAREAAKDVLL